MSLVLSLYLFWLVETGSYGLFVSHLLGKIR